MYFFKNASLCLIKLRTFKMSFKKLCSNKFFTLNKTVWVDPLGLCSPIWAQYPW